MSRWTCLALEVESVRPEGLEDARVVALADGLARLLGLELPGTLEHRYAPQGLSLVRHGLDGRLAIHTWPERGVATIDVWAPLGVLDGKGEALAGWLASQDGYRVVGSRLHPHPRSPFPIG